MDASIVTAHYLPFAFMNHPMMPVTQGLLPKGAFGAVVTPNEEAIHVKTRSDTRDTWKAAERAA